MTLTGFNNGIECLYKSFFILNTIIQTSPYAANSNNQIMIPRLKRILISAIIFLSGFLTNKVASAQSLFGNWFPERSVSFEYNHPVFRQPSSFKSRNSVSFININWQLNDKTEFVADLPWAFANSEDSVQSIRAYTLGNPYLGLQFRRPLSVFFIETGLRFPVTSIYPVVSRLGDESLLNRSGAFRNRTWILKADLNFHYEYVTGFSMRLRAGPRFLIPVHSATPDVMLDYSAQVRFKTRFFLIGAAYIGNLDATKSVNTSIHQLVFETMINGKVFEPQFRLYIPNQAKGSPEVHYTIGFGLKMILDNI